MTHEQPLAIRLASLFESCAIDHEPMGWPAIQQADLNRAAAELRKLHAENAKLREALDALINAPWSGLNVDKARAALAQGEKG